MRALGGGADLVLLRLHSSSISETIPSLEKGGVHPHLIIMTTKYSCLADGHLIKKMNISKFLKMMDSFMMLMGYRMIKERGVQY
jgi:hypothetical protein